ncbi:MAG: thioredoxin [Candidatus Aminicenantes bacterium]
MSKVIEVTDNNFEEEVLDSDIPVEVDFWAPWCAPCNVISPIYENLAEEYKDFKFCKMNVDENKQTAMKYRIMSIPMQIFFVNGKKVDEILGAVPEQTIRSKIEEVLDNYPVDELGRFKKILTLWIEHNEKYGSKFRKWNEKHKSMGDKAIYDSLLQTAQDIEKLNRKLSQYLNELLKKI